MAGFESVWDITVVGEQLILGKPQPPKSETLEMLTYPDESGIFKGTLGGKDIAGAISPLFGGGKYAFHIAFHRAVPGNKQPGNKQPDNEDAIFMVEFFHGVIVGSATATDSFHLDNVKYMQGSWHKTFPMTLVPVKEKFVKYKIVRTHEIYGTWTASQQSNPLQ